MHPLLLLPFTLATWSLRLAAWLLPVVLWLACVLTLLSLQVAILVIATLAWIVGRLFGRTSGPVTSRLWVQASPLGLLPPPAPIGGAAWWPLPGSDRTLLVAETRTPFEPLRWTVPERPRQDARERVATTPPSAEPVGVGPATAKAFRVRAERYPWLRERPPTA